MVLATSIRHWYSQLLFSDSKGRHSIRFPHYSFEPCIISYGDLTFSIWYLCYIDLGTLMPFSIQRDKPASVSHIVLIELHNLLEQHLYNSLANFTI